MPLPIAREPLDPHAPTRTRCQRTDAGCQTSDRRPDRPVASWESYSYEHTRSCKQMTDAGYQMSGDPTPRSDGLCIRCKTRTASDKHRLSRPHPYRGDDRRLDGCQNPLHAVQEPEIGCRMPDVRTPASNSDLRKSTNQYRKTHARIRRADLCRTPPPVCQAAGTACLLACSNVRTPASNSDFSKQDVREQMSDDRHRSRTSKNNLTKRPAAVFATLDARVLASVIRHSPSGLEPIGVEPTTS